MFHFKGGMLLRFRFENFFMFLKKSNYISNSKDVHYSDSNSKDLSSSSSSSTSKVQTDFPANSNISTHNMPSTDTHIWKNENVLIPMTEELSFSKTSNVNDDDDDIITMCDDHSTINKLKHCSFNNIKININTCSFDSDSVKWCVDSCATGELAGFKSDFIPGSYEASKTETSTESTTGSTSIIGTGTERHFMLDDNGEYFEIFTKMSHAPLCKCRLMAPQWLGIQQKQ